MLSELKSSQNSKGLINVIVQKLDRIRPFLTVPFIFQFAISTPAFSGVESAERCPEFWKPTVNEVSERLNHPAPHIKVLFQSDSGKIYNCLNLKLSSEEELDLLRHSEFSEWVSENRGKEGEGNEVPVGACTKRVLTKDGTPQFITLVLPMDMEVMNLPKCQKQLASSISRIFGYE